METPRSSDALPRSGDASLFSNTSAQWRNAIYATAAASRFRNSLYEIRARQEGGSVGLDHLHSETQTTQNGAPSKHDDTRSRANQKEKTNQAAQLDPKALEKTSGDKKPEIEVLKLIRDELVKQLDAYGLVLVLLAGITFVAILQPPGSFDNGKLRGSLLVSFFSLLATLSFFIACTGLGAVMVGCAQLFRPNFYFELTQNVNEFESKWLQANGVSAHHNNNNSPSTETPALRRALRKWLPGSWELNPRDVAYDNIDVLAKLCVENVDRIRRIRFYLGVALVLCIAAYICGALAVMVTNDRQRYLLIGAMGAGGVIVVFEICITVSAAMKPVSKSSASRSVETGTRGGSRKYLRYLTKKYSGHPVTLPERLP